MSFETKEQILEKLLDQEKPACPHCQVEMTLWEVPEIAVGDGLGWGTPYLYICFNDDCEAYKNGWDEIRETLAHNASYRCMNFPGTSNFEFIPVFSPEGAKGQAIDNNIIMEQEALKEKIKKGFSILTDFYINKDWDEILKLALDPLEPARVRLKAIEMVGDIADMEAIEHLINHKFPNKLITEEAIKAVAKLHKRHYTKECPFCAEIIKKRAKICKNCGKETS